MTSSPIAKPTILVLGATGGCALAFLVRALNAGYNCNTLVRTPSKLTNLLKSRNVPADIISRHLTIIHGDARDSTKISEALFIDGRVVDLVVSGLGVTPKLTLRQSQDHFDICERGTVALLDAIRSASPSKKPVLVAISTTGISNYGRDIPVAMIPLYHWLLPVPHKDKKAMEDALTQEVKSASSVLGGFIAVRPSLLTNGPERGVEKVRVGLENLDKLESLAIGYTISREDVGNWIFEEVLGRELAGGAYLNRFVTLTY